jgi:hypothetical protein
MLKDGEERRKKIMCRLLQKELKNQNMVDEY